jgi:2,3-bisphosphoglycerate-independent phosphoglycerate mutase
VPANLAFVCLTRYDESLPLPVAFPPEDVLETLGDLYAGAGRRQLRIAETEKYAHVTYFFSGGREAELAGEERCLVPSPKVATYDLEPAMSAVPLTDEAVRRITDEPLDLVVLNYANADMVGHTASCPRPSGRSRRSTPASPASPRRCAHGAACSRSPPTTATPSR